MFSGVLPRLLLLSFFALAEEDEEVVKCAERRLLYQAGGCHPPLSRGPCREGEVVVEGEQGSGECRGWGCKEDEVLWGSGDEERCRR